MCCLRPSEEHILQMELQRRQQKAVDDLAAAIENAETPEIKGIAVEGKKNDAGIPGLRKTKLNG